MIIRIQQNYKKKNLAILTHPYQVEQLTASSVLLLLKIQLDIMLHLTKALCSGIGDTITWKTTFSTELYILSRIKKAGNRVEDSKQNEN